MTDTIHFVVRNVEMKKDPCQPIFSCGLEGRGQKVSFILILPKEPVGWSVAPAQYAVVSPHLRVGTILSCELAYAFGPKVLAAMLMSFYQIEVRDMKGNLRDGDAYFALGENPTVSTKRVGSVVSVPGGIPLCGDAFLPIFGQERVKHTREQFHHRRGLRWGRRPTWLRRWWWNRVAQRRGIIVGPT